MLLTHHFPYPPRASYTVVLKRQYERQLRKLDERERQLDARDTKLDKRQAEIQKEEEDPGNIETLEKKNNEQYREI